MVESGLGIWVWTVDHESIVSICPRCATPLGCSHREQELIR